MKSRSASVPYAAGISERVTPCYSNGLDLTGSCRRSTLRGASGSRCGSVTITLNGEPFHLDAPTTVAALLAQLDLDPRRIAVEHNLAVLKRGAYEQTTVREGDQIEIVNFVGGG